ncbi:hypothetical protein [Mastigocoleus sp. MO_188.B34]|uniref:hypothetical protein n=1 Tax=Mastigocoleus sp. MO_188.B34 TaxID=3036635 RepID=UPI0026063599|nr:hypothetical protein [Mastigocoleus sp. MO_188.B34]MDJ0693448.1 hypothetical protein [Mastigocoleus sp. MO_188.B34]
MDWGLAVWDWGLGIGVECVLMSAYCGYYMTRQRHMRTGNRESMGRRKRYFLLP